MSEAGGAMAAPLPHPHHPGAGPGIHQIGFGWPKSGEKDPHNVHSPVRALAFGFGGGDEDALAVVAASMDLGETGGGAGDETFALAGPAAFVAPCGTQPSVKITICITESNRKTPTRTRPARISKHNRTHLLYSWNVEHRTFHLGVGRSLRFSLRWLGSRRHKRSECYLVSGGK